MKLVVSPILSIILLTVSAAIKTALSGKSSSMEHLNSANDGTIRSDSGNLEGGFPLSCVPDNTLNFSCHVTTIDTVTTGHGVLSDNLFNNTNMNTSISNPYNTHDTTSSEQ